MIASPVARYFDFTVRLRPERGIAACERSALRLQQVMAAKVMTGSLFGDRNALRVGRSEASDRSVATGRPSFQRLESGPRATSQAITAIMALWQLWQFSTGWS